MNPYDSKISKCLEGLSIDTLSAIQEKCIPLMLNGQSVTALAPTGSGKTLAFLLPICLLLESHKRQIQSVILVPTRELGQQIAQVAQKVTEVIFSEYGENILVRTAFGGHSIQNQIEEISKQPHILIGTPGRILDLLDRNALSFSHLKNFVLDEADVMVGMGFSEQVEKICHSLSPVTQVSCFSATQNDKVTALENTLKKTFNLVLVTAYKSCSDDNENYHSAKIDHKYVLLNEDESKFQALLRVLTDSKVNALGKGIVFCHTRQTAQDLADQLKKNGLYVDVLSGDLGQIQRNSIMRNFKSGNLQFLIATNIAARGIDVPDLSIVIHYDIPYTKEEYIHRTGRTGRAQNSGICLSICEHKIKNAFRRLIQELKIKIQKIELNNEIEPLSMDQRSISFQKIFINKGKQSKIRPGDIVGAFVQDIKLNKEDIGAIYIFNNFTHVEINSKKVNSLFEKQIKIKNLNVLLSQANF